MGSGKFPCYKMLNYFMEWEVYPYLYPELCDWSNYHTYLYNRPTSITSACVPLETCEIFDFSMWQIFRFLRSLVMSFIILLLCDPAYQIIWNHVIGEKDEWKSKSGYTNWKVLLSWRGFNRYWFVIYCISTLSEGFWRVPINNVPVCKSVSTFQRHLLRVKRGYHHLREGGEYNWWQEDIR